jgi:hypothetical protein
MKELGYEEISASKFDEANSLLAFDVHEYSDDWNVDDSLAET